MKKRRGRLKKIPVKNYREKEVYIAKKSTEYMHFLKGRELNLQQQKTKKKKKQQISPPYFFLDDGVWEKKTDHLACAEIRFLNLDFKMSISDLSV